MRKLFAVTIILTAFASLQGCSSSQLGSKDSYVNTYNKSASTSEEKS